MTETNAITTDERYTSATHSSNMRVEADKRGDADLIIAAGMSPSRLGAALLRLHSERDGVSMPPHMTPERIKAYAMTLTGTPTEKLAKAHQAAHDWHMHEVKMMLGRLKSLPAVRGELLIVADRLGVAGDTSIEVLMWWLDRVCKVCKGQQREVIPNTPMLSKVMCPECRGSGEARLPGGQSGRKIEAHINHCLDAARGSIKQRLRG